VTYSSPSKLVNDMVTIAKPYASHLRGCFNFKLFEIC